MRLSLSAAMAFAIFGLISEQSVLAESNLLSSDPSAFATASAGYTVYQSQLVQSNEPVLTHNYRAGVFGGETRQLAIILDVENGSYRFPLNGSRIDSSAIDIGFRYVWLPFFGGLILNNSEIRVSAPEDTDQDGHLDVGSPAKDYMKINSRGLGAVVGASYEVSKTATVFSEASVVESLGVNESYIEDPLTVEVAARKSIQLGRRIKMNIGGLVQITKKHLDFTFGYQKQQLPITAEGQTFVENQDMIFAGLRLRATF